MMIFRAKVVKMIKDMIVGVDNITNDEKISKINQCRILVPSLSNSSVDAYICSQKGITIQYNADDVVFVAWLGETDWIILGSPYVVNSIESAAQIKTDVIIAENGRLSKNIQVSNSQASLCDIIDTKRTLASKENA